MRKVNIFLALLGLCFLGSTVHAEEVDNNVGFSVYPNFNKSQNKNSSFFDLQVTPNSDQNIGITITNTSQVDSDYKIKVVQASTNKNGLIDYTDSEGSTNNPPINLSKNTTYEKCIELKSGHSRQIPIQIHIPRVKFKGEVLGGISVTKVPSKNKKQYQITNQYSYVLGLRLRQTVEDPPRNLSAGDVKPNVSFGKSGVTVPILNAQSNSMGNLIVDSILKRNGMEVKKETYKNREIAPNSVYPYSLSWNTNDYIPGKYQLDITVTDAQFHKWIFKKEFTLSPKEVSRIKYASIKSSNEYNGWLILLIVLFLVVILALIIYILKNRKKGKKIGDSYSVD